MKIIQAAKTPEMAALLKRAGSNDFNVAMAAQRDLAVALELPLRQGILNGDILGAIFEQIRYEPGQTAEYPLDLISPGTEKDFVAYTLPNAGRIPERHVEGDYVMVPTFDVGCSIDTNIKYVRDGRWDIVGRMMQVMEASFTRKANDDGWHVILAAANNRNIVVYDNQATSGLFSKRLVSQMNIVMRRNAGGNSTSLKRGKLTDLWASPEALEDIRSWDLSQVDDVTRRAIFISENGLMNIFSVMLHPLDELGVGQDFQKYFANTLGGSLPSDKVEICVGLDLVNRDSFVMPTRADMEIFEDPTLHRQRRVGFYGWAEHGFGVLDSRRVLLGAL